MIQFFINLFNAIFGKKKNNAAGNIPQSTPTVIADKPEITKSIEVKVNKIEPIDFKEQIKEFNESLRVKESKRWTWRGNRLHIKYNNDCRNFNLNGKIESMRCTSIERARQIASGIQSYCIDKILFTDAKGQQFVIKS